MVVRSVTYIIRLFLTLIVTEVVIDGGSLPDVDETEELGEEREGGQVTLNPNKEIIT